MESEQRPETRNGIVTVAASHSVDETLARLQQLLTTKGVKIFALIDHSGEAESVGLSMPNTKLIVFGNPKAGTPLMVAAPTIAIDLPLKILVWEDLKGKVWISYNTAEFLSDRHGIPLELRQTLAVAGALSKTLSDSP